MKSKSEIESRLRSLRVKYAKRYISNTQSRCHQNCIYNREHTPLGQYSKSRQTDTDLAPRKQVTLVVMQPQSTIRLCMYGSDDPANWPGDICDKDEIAHSCKMFEPRVPASAARDEFLKNLEDDEWVFDNYRDMAALQWVLSDRLHKMQLSFIDRLILWLQIVFLRREKPTPLLPEESLPENLWEDNVAPSPTRK